MSDLCPKCSNRLSEYDNEPYCPKCGADFTRNELKLYALLDKYRAALEKLEWVKSHAVGDYYCIACNNWKVVGHHYECWLDALLHPKAADVLKE